jgi:hypothetical protein
MVIFVQKHLQLSNVAKIVEDWGENLRRFVGFNPYIKYKSTDVFHRGLEL